MVVQECMTRMVVLSILGSLDITHEITLIIDTHIRRGPDLLPHTAEIRYERGSPSPTYLETRSSVFASMRKEAARSRNGADCAAIDVVRTRGSELASGRMTRYALTSSARRTRVYPRKVSIVHHP